MTSSGQFFYTICGASICGTNRILFYSLGKLVHQNSETTQDSELVFVNSIWKEHVEKAIIVIFVMNKNRRESRYLDECSSLSLMVKCQMDKKFLAF